LTEALRLHGGRSLQIFEVRISIRLMLVFPLSFSPKRFMFRFSLLSSRHYPRELQSQVSEKFNRLAELSSDLDWYRG
jgi:hypothetical protein